jgi:hypothetical protein
VVWGRAQAGRQGPHHPNDPSLPSVRRRACPGWRRRSRPTRSLLLRFGRRGLADPPAPHEQPDHEGGVLRGNDFQHVAKGSALEGGLRPPAGQLAQRGGQRLDLAQRQVQDNVLGAEDAGFQPRSSSPATGRRRLGWPAPARRRWRPGGCRPGRSGAGPGGSRCDVQETVAKTNSRRSTDGLHALAPHLDRHAL